jgi:AraC family transcriptional regulator of adaptative response / DNA-3-methyladenine glycosylase II
MHAEDAAAYEAFKAHDARFDGRIFVGVTSTGIYCRPICKVRTPRRENCRFFQTAAQAEAAAFRPCLKCRPEVAPGPGWAWSTMDASRTLARQAAQWLDGQVGREGTALVMELAATLGVSDRHLRRIFLAEHGVTPLQYLQTRRLLTAKQLLTDTPLPVAQVALASGFGSLRRFNAAFLDRYRMSPTQLRADAGAPADAPEALTLRLGYRPPYDAAALLRFVAQRAIPGIEAVEGPAIRRSVRAGVISSSAGWLEVRFEAEAAARGCHITLRFSSVWAPQSAQLVSRVRRWLDLDAAPDTIDAALADLPGAPGLRLPGSVDAFELVVRAVLGQQVTVAAARTLARRLAERFGEPVVSPWPEVSQSFPAPERLAQAPIESIAELGIIRSRASALQALAGEWPRWSTMLNSGSPEAAIEALCTLPGIGPWTAHYIAMRALGWPDAFPPKDVAVLKAMRALHGVGSAGEAEAWSQRWRPWRSYAVLRLWNSLAAPAPSTETAATPWPAAA